MARRSPAAWPRPARCPRTSQGLCLDGETSRLGQDGAEAAPTRRVPRPPGLLVWTFKAETVTRAGLATQLPRAYSSVPAAVTNIRVSAQFTSHSHPAQASRGALPQRSLGSQAPSVYWRTRVHTGQARPRARRTTVTPGRARPCAPAPPPPAQTHSPACPVPPPRRPASLQRSVPLRRRRGVADTGLLCLKKSDSLQEAGSASAHAAGVLRAAWAHPGDLPTWAL